MTQDILLINDVPNCVHSELTKKDCRFAGSRSPHARLTHLRLSTVPDFDALTETPSTLHIDNGKYQGGGGLLMMAAPRPNSDSDPAPPSYLTTGRRGEGTKSSAAGNGGGAGGPASALGQRGFEPFVQLASWGEGSFTPLAQFTSAGLLLGGGSGGRGGAGSGGESGGGSENGGGWWGIPSGVGAAAGAGAGNAFRPGSGQEENCGNLDCGHSIRTREGGLEIAPAGGDRRLRWRQAPKRIGSRSAEKMLASL